MKKNIIKIILISLSLIILVACNVEDAEETVKFPDIDRIFIKLLSDQELGDIRVYSVELENQINETIVQNEVYLSYYIINGNGKMLNKLVVRGKNNKLNIKHGEKVILNFVVPINVINTNLVDSDNICLEIIGYINRVSVNNRFQKVGDINVFSKVE